MKRRKKLPYVIIILACIFLLIPFAATLVYSFTIGWTKLFPAGWTFKYWIQAFTEPTLWPAILRGVLISIPPILICNIVVILALYTSVVYYPKLEKYIQTICMIPNSLKGVTIAIPVLALYAGGVTFFSNRMVMLVCIYSISILPFVYQGILKQSARNQRYPSSGSSGNPGCRKIIRIYPDYSSEYAGRYPGIFSSRSLHSFRRFCSHKNHCGKQIRNHSDASVQQPSDCTAVSVCNCNHHVYSYSGYFTACF